jgi:hypothetical protein
MEFNDFREELDAIVVYSQAREPYRKEKNRFEASVDEYPPVEDPCDVQDVAHRGSQHESYRRAC